MDKLNFTLFKRQYHEFGVAHQFFLCVFLYCKLELNGLGIVKKNIVSLLNNFNYFYPFRESSRPLKLARLHFKVLTDLVSNFYYFTAFKEIGGLDNLERLYMSPESYPNETIYANNTCGIPRADSLHIWRGLDSDLPWLGFIVGHIWCALWYWAADQVRSNTIIFCLIWSMQ